MKRLLFLFISFFIVGNISAQVFTKKTEANSEGKSISTINVKTTINIDPDNCIITVKEGNNTPDIYYIAEIIDSYGDENTSVQLGSHTYGREISYGVTKEMDFKSLAIKSSQIEDEEEWYGFLLERIKVVTHRIITVKENPDKKMNEYVWIKDREGNRIIYSK